MKSYVRELMEERKIMQETQENPQYRAVQITFDNLPSWGAPALFKLIREAMGRPDVGEVSASLTIEYTDLTPDDEKKLSGLEDELWLSSYDPRPPGLR